MAVLFDATAESLVRSNIAYTDAIDSRQDFSFVIWLEALVSLPDPGRYRTFFTMWAEPYQTVIWLGQNDFGNIELYGANKADLSDEVDVNTSFTLNSPQWYGFGYTYEAASGQHTLYHLNGFELEEVTTMSLTYDQDRYTNVMYLGDDGGESWSETGIAYFRMWQTKLTELELRRELFAHRAVKKSHLFMDTPLEDDFLDISSNGYDWSTTGTPTIIPSPNQNKRIVKHWKIYRFDLKSREEDKA